MLTDLEYMERALLLAERGRGRTSPNPLVGAVVVTPDGVIAGDGYHRRAGEAHAEILALEAAGERARGAALYCTLEPCCHTGRTGPCVERIVSVGIARVVAAVEDPNPRVCQAGFAYLREHGVSVAVGVGRDAALRLNQPFFTLMRRRRPFVILKAATSLDGRIAAAPGVRTRLTSNEALRRIHALRAEVDAIAVGSGTVLADDPLLTARGVFRPRPLTRVIFDSTLRTPPSARLFSTLAAGPVIVFTTESGLAAAPVRARALAAAGATLEALPARDVSAALQRLAACQVTSVLLEGGASIHAAAWDAGLVDFVQLYVAPCVLGDAGIPLLAGRLLTMAALAEARAETCGPDTLIEGYVHRPH